MPRYTDPGEHLFQPIFKMQIECGILVDVLERDFSQQNVASALHDPQQLLPGLAPIVRVLHRLQNRNAIEILVGDVPRVIVLPSGELAPGSAPVVEIGVASLIGDIDDADFALRTDPVADVVWEPRPFDDLAEKPRIRTLSPFLRSNRSYMNARMTAGLCLHI